MDKWFWDINNDYTPQTQEELNSGCLYGEGNNGLGVIPNTQKSKYNFKYEFKDGENKPIFYLKKIILSYLK